MDHLPLPRNPVGPVIRVPYLCEEDFDGGTLADFPARRGWKLTFGRGICEFEPNGTAPSARQIEAFVQTWLFFGLLHHTVGPTYRKTTWYTTDNEGNKWLSTSELPKLIAEWSQDLLGLKSLKDLQPLRKKLLDIRMNIGIVRLYILEVVYARLDVLSAESILAIAILAETLSQVPIDVRNIGAVEELMKDTPVDQYRWRVGTRDFDTGMILLEFMAKMGWCAHDLAQIRSTVAYISTLYYFANLPPPKAYASHEKCTDEVCTIARIAPKTYKLSHVVDGCGCALVHVEHDALSAILQAGQLPLVYVTENQDGQALLDVRPYAEGDDFVAISHVWAEGLGNPSDNALHSCELLRLASLAKSTGAENSLLPFWIDTICVPVRPKELQKLALTRMRDPFQRATYVLVLDASMRNTTAAGMDTMEAFGRTLCSTWAQRLWTLQEGRLAREVLFQYKDQAVSLKERFQAAAFGASSQVYRRVEQDLILNYNASRFTDRLPDFNGNLLSTRLSLRTRSVSVASDEALCVACLMNMELHDLTTTPEDHRMEVLWRKIGPVPSGMVFSHAPRKLSAAGLRWAPESFLGLTPATFGSEDLWSGPKMRQEKLDATLTDRGLAVRLPGLLLHSDIRNVGDRYPDESRGSLRTCPFTYDARGKWYLLDILQPWTDKPRPKHSPGHTRQAIILDESLLSSTNRGDKARYIVNFENHGMGQPICGVLVDIVAQDNSGGGFVVHGLQHVAIVPLHHGFAKALQMAKSLSTTVIANHDPPWRPQQENVAFWTEQAAKALQKDVELRGLYDEHARVRHRTDGPSPSAVDYLAESIELFACAGDRLALEPTADDQLWYVD